MILTYRYMYLYVSEKRVCAYLYDFDIQVHIPL